MNEFQKVEKLYKVLGDKTRLMILNRIHQGDQCGCDLIDGLEISQPTLSHHLKVLKDHGFIHGIRDQNRILFTINKEKIEEVNNYLSTILKQTTICKEC